MVAMPLLVKEKPPLSNYTQHDLLYKELIHTFFAEFLAVFFPDVHKNIDFHRIKPLSEEMHTDITKGKTHRLDIVIETILKGTDVVVIVHIEPQSYQQAHFSERMYHYFSMLYNKYRKPIIPIAILSHDANWEENCYTMAFDFLPVLTFNYLTLHLKKQYWRDYIRSNNPVAAALLSEMGYSKEERVQVKKEFLRMITRMELNPAKQRMIYGFFESYLKLTEDEEEQLMTEINKLPEADKVLELTISYEEKGKEIGKKEGELIGVKKVAVEMLKEKTDLAFIARVTQLDIEEIKQLEKQL
ncbi:Rpn family recombination-promoting nuclease/putative transposase [Amphibacillus sp. Q70]|uniref:Rpn family recombination-promoting nuclease/putative transposase n=1 Tax=Amphibacillus sp. Q70 TaxID=3453416 RepID=UPI003F84E58F